MEDVKPVAVEDPEFSDEDLEIVELPQREAMSLLNIHVHNLFHGLF